MGENARPEIRTLYPAKREVHQERHDHRDERPFADYADHVLEREKERRQAGQARHTGIPYVSGIWRGSPTTQYADFRQYEREFNQRSAGRREWEYSPRVEAFAEAGIEQTNYL